MNSFSESMEKSAIQTTNNNTYIYINLFCEESEEGAPRGLPLLGDDDDDGYMDDVDDAYVYGETTHQRQNWWAIGKSDFENDKREQANDKSVS